MTSKKILDWITTEKGRTYAFYSAGIATTSVLLANFVPHTFLVDQYKDFIHLYRNGMAVPLPKNLQNRFQKALDLVNVPQEDRQFYKPFFAYGFDVISIGSILSRFGVLVGIPANFAYENQESVDKTKIKANQESVVWESEEGQSLLDSLVLSENAQLYAIAKEIKFRQTPKLYLDTFFATSPCVLAYGLGTYLNNKFSLLSKPRSVRIIMYTLVGLFSFGNYVMFKDLSQIYFEGKIDKELRENDPVFGEGGEEYYNKILQRNIALRKILGREGERLYTVLGNENYFFRTKHIPLVQRKKFFEKTPELPS